MKAMILGFAAASALHVYPALASNSQPTAALDAAFAKYARATEVSEADKARDGESSCFYPSVVRLTDFLEVAPNTFAVTAQINCRDEDGLSNGEFITQLVFGCATDGTVCSKK